MNDVTEEDKHKPIRVVDRRMFTSEGDLRPDFQPEEREEPAKPPPPRAPAPPDASSAPPPPPSAPPSPRAAPAEQDLGGDPGAPPHPPAGEEEGALLEIVRSLGTTAYAALGLVPDPTGARRPEPAVARQMIDWLAVLEQKTRGNLTFQESDMLARVLYELRMAYVEVMRPPGAEPKR